MACYNIVLVFIFMIFKIIKADENEYRLINDLLKNYNIYARPTPHFTIPTNVTFGLSLSQLIDVDEKNQIMTTNCWITMFWVDEKLKWNSSTYGGIREIRLPHDKIWKPDVILYNNADTLASISQISTQMMIESNGNVTWLSTSIFKSACSINVQYFPFDIQNCSLPFASWTYDGYGINLMKNSDFGDLSNYIANGEWSLEDLSVYQHNRVYSCCPNPYPNVTYHVIIKRRPLFYVFNMILPSMLITIVGYLGFLIPPDSGEKVSMGVTTLLSMTVFLMLVAENMPPNSDSVPLIASYYFGSMFIISLATAGTVLTLNIHKKGNEGKPVSELAQKIFFGVIAKILFINIDAKISKNKSKIAPSRSKYISLFRDTLKDVKICKNSDENEHFSIENFVLTESKNNEKNKCKTCCTSPRTNYKSNRLLIRESPLMACNKSNVKKQKIDDECLEVNNEEKTEINLLLRPRESEGKLSQEYLNDQKKLIKMLKELNTNLQNYELKALINDYKEEVKFQWTQLAYVIDALLGYAFVISSFFLIFFLIYKIPNARFY